MSKHSHKLMGKEVGAASTYAEPHTMQGKKVTPVKAGKEVPFEQKKGWNPDDGVSLTAQDHRREDSRHRRRH